MNFELDFVLKIGSEKSLYFFTRFSLFRPKIDLEKQNRDKGFVLRRATKSIFSSVSSKSTPVLSCAPSAEPLFQEPRFGAILLRLMAVSMTSEFVSGPDLALLFTKYNP